MAEFYWIGHLADAPQAGRPPKTQSLKWSEIGVRQNPLRKNNERDPMWVKDWILREVHRSQRTAEQMLNEHNRRVFLLTRAIIKHWTRHILHEDSFGPLAILQPQ
jgi:hypothetical protein